MSTTSTALQIAALNALKEATFPLEIATLILFQNNLTLTRETLMAELEEADFTGYAADAAVAWGDAYLDPLSGVRMDSALAHAFVATAATVGNTVYGWAVVNAGKTVLYFAKLFDDAYVIDAAGVGVTVSPSIEYGD